jgi:autotransporter-like protein
MRLLGAVALVVLLATPVVAADRLDAPPRQPEPFFVPVVSAEGFGQTGRFDTGDLNTAHTFGTHGYDVSFGARLGRHLMIALRGQETWTDVELYLAPQTISVHSRSLGVRTRVEVGPVFWDTTASRGTNRNSTAIFLGPGVAPAAAQWGGREWAVDSIVGGLFPLGPVFVEPFAGGRVNTLQDDGYTTDATGTVPGQFRSTTTFRGGVKLGAPIRLDEVGTLTPWVRGEVSRTSNPHPPLGAVTDLTGMAGGHYVFALPQFESPGPFPGQTWRTVSAGVSLDVSPAYTLTASAVWSGNDLGSWLAYRLNAAIRF